MMHLALAVAVFLTLVGPASADFKAGLEAFDKGDYAAALREWMPEAQQGDAAAQNNLGLIYDKGLGVSQSDTEAVKRYRSAADQNHVKAQFNLGVMYEKGRGVSQSDVEAVQWYRKAADQGHASAQFALGLMYDRGQGVPRDYAEAVKRYRSAADQNHVKAQFNLGVMYEKGRGVPRSNVEAINWYRKAADQGDANAQNILGDMYARGRGVPRDYTEAVKWLRKAADQGDAVAQKALGVMYERGRGVRRDLAEARRWFARASAGSLAGTDRADAIVTSDQIAREAAPGPAGLSRRTSRATRVLFEDDLRSRRNWKEGVGNRCKTFYGDGGIIVESMPPAGTCEFDLWNAGSFQENVRIEVSARLRRGAQDRGYGLKFGTLAEGQRSATYHVFAVSADGGYMLGTWNGGWSRPIGWTIDAVVKKGFGATNRLAIEIRGRTIRCYINEQFVAAAVSPADVRGHIGLFLDEMGMEAVFANLRVLELPGK